MDKVKGFRSMCVSLAGLDSTIIRSVTLCQKHAAKGDCVHVVNRQPSVYTGLWYASHQVFVLAQGGQLKADSKRPIIAIAAHPSDPQVSRRVISQNRKHLCRWRSAV